MEWSVAENNYYQTIHGAINKTAFLICHYLVIEDGEQHMLISGDTDTGKTGTSYRLIRYTWKHLNLFYKPYIEWQLKEKHYMKNDGSYYENFTDLIAPKFRMREHFAFMNEKSNRQMLTASPFPLIVYDEGNAKNINLKSMDPESVDETIIAFGARNKHPFVIYNYHNSNRPTLFLREKFGMWTHKMHKKLGFFMIRQRLIVPPKDPWLVKKLPEILETGHNEAIYGFFKEHPYTMAEWKNIRDMPPKARARYARYRQEEQIAYNNRMGTDLVVNEAREEIATRFFKEVDDGNILYADLNKKLSEAGVKLVSEQNRIRSMINGKLTTKNIKKYAKVMGLEEEAGKIVKE